MPFTKEHYKDYFLQQFNEILFDQQKLIDAIVSLKVLKIKGQETKVNETEAEQALKKYDPLTYYAIAENFDFDTSLGDESLHKKYSLDSTSWSNSERLFIGAAYSQAVAKTSEKLIATDMVNDNLSPLEMDELETNDPIAIEYQKLKEYVKDQGGLYNELGNSAVDQVREAFKFHKSTKALKSISNQKSLTQSEFENIAFNASEIESDIKDKKDALKYIMRGSSEEQVNNLIKLIRDNNIHSLDELNSKRKELIKQTNPDEVFKKYGIDQSPITWSQNIANFKKNTVLNNLFKETQNSNLKLLIAATQNNLNDSNLCVNIQKIETATRYITSECDKILQSGTLRQTQNLEVNKHKENLLNATVEFAANSLLDPSKVDEYKVQHVKTVKESEASCRNKINDTVGRKILSGLTNFLSHLTLVGMIANVVNKYKTGNWLLFKHNEESRKLKEVDTNITSGNFGPNL